MQKVFLLNRFRVNLLFMVVFCGLFAFGFSMPTPQLTGDAKKVEFASLDGLTIRADYYDNNIEGSPTIVLCHQAGWSRGEYNEIIVELIGMGYNCLAIDQRSGGQVNGITNETAQRAKADGKGTSYLDAEQDIRAAVIWAGKKSDYIILWGSSYSSSLVLKVASEEKVVSKVLSFSPGEYFGDKMNLKEKIKNLKKPVFITCAKREIKRTQPIFDIIPSKHKTFFKPSTAGNHGSRALWSKFEDHEAYWKAVKAFLNKN